ncbi:PREDICTED: RNA exonuclease 1 homolog, partial [Nanorana parkeri]|uniref:RNA exonuclease 1 homolog n=1 Tax=Nanorana parkeri TaxID=125878 RepID=UPI000853F4AD
MLKSTGYFRGVECPFRESCRRPHCHFRHRGRGAPNIGGEARNGAEYDPYSPELPPVPVCSDDDFSGAVLETCHDTLELDRVNKAIEEVKNEVEREQRKYEELLEIQKEYIPSLKRSAKSVSSSHLEYSPVGSGSSALCYNPTALSHSVKPCKYTLDDCENEMDKSRCMEYIPTAISKRIAKKYVIDNSKPSTDMEYDPMSNYSARLLNKAIHRKVTKSTRDAQDKGCAPHAKKVRRQSSDLSVEATFSDSEDDSGSPLAAKKTLLTGVEDKSAQAVNTFSLHYNMDGVKQLKKCKHKDHAKKVSHANYKSEKKEIVSQPPSGTASDKSKAFSKGQKKEKTYLAKKSEMSHVKNRKLESDKKAKKDDILSEKNARLNTDVSVKNNEKNQSKAKKGKVNLLKDSRHGIEDNSGKQKVKEVKSEAFGKSKEPAQRMLKTRTKQRTLSHVDLFGDESSEEEEIKMSINSSSGCEKVANSTERIISTSRRSSTSSHGSSDIDYSILEKNLDSDPDPMEECLRIFNESQDIKTEDKGRKGKQLKEDGTENSGPNMTAAFPSQKKRISHVNHSNHVSDL